MGQNNQSAINFKENDVFSTSETKHLTEVYAKIAKTLTSTKDQSDQYASFPSAILFQYLHQKGYLNNITSFKDFVAKCLRSNQTILLQTIWDLIDDNDQNKLQTFFIILLQLLKYNTIQINKLSLLFVQRIAFDSNNNIDAITTDNFIRLQNWINKEAPFLPHIYETFFNYFFLGQNNRPDFIHRYIPPCLLHTSNIIDSAMIFPLSLYHNKLQGMLSVLFTKHIML